MFLISIAVTAVVAWSDMQTVVVGVRNADDFAHIVATRLQAELADQETLEFSNENTFSRIRTRLLDRDVVIALPAKVNANQLMEVLIKIHTARVSGARRIQIYSETSLEDVQFVTTTGVKHLNLEHLLVVAGAKHLTENHGVTRSLRGFSRSQMTFQESTGSLIVDSGHSFLAKELSEKTGVEIFKPQATKPLGKTIFLIAPPVSPVNEKIFEMLVQVYDWSRFGNRVVLVSPYMPYARSDKIDQPGVSVTARLMADLIEAFGAYGVMFVRPHAIQAQGFFSVPTFNLTGRQTIDSYLARLGVELISAPDAGAQKDATFYAKDLGVGLVTINKYRNPITNEIELAGVVGADPAGKIVAIVDDETASGKTLAEAAELLKAKGAKKVIAVVTHLAGSATEAFRSSAIDLIVATNTFPVDHLSNEKLKILSIADEMAPLIRDLSSGGGACESLLAI